MRDPLLPAYKAIRAAIEHVHGTDFPVLDAIPPPAEFKKQIPAANITYISGTLEKALMREHEPHAMKLNHDGTYTVATESSRFDYLLQVSFFAERPGIAQKLSNEFMAYIETENDIPIPNDKWEKSIEIFLTAPPLPPRGEPDVYQVDATYRCRGKLLTESIANAINSSNFKPKVR
ncbi:hypothetical protein [Aneurinibacillus aneurinilyticus]|jgi:hypothetical protein|uniref:hypothetical protein n=1 Tax=Aneurinibacillus aneurinilyticus TaxID=1391 RepID=UPI0023F79F8C|nr:hypothetical protein [Aneurinibacillus aneurinilyticus]MCI1696470.1 hypothetical protein [Aneurinibacillus aneurinilyticus]